MSSAYSEAYKGFVEATNAFALAQFKYGNAVGLFNEEHRQFDTAQRQYQQAIKDFDRKKRAEEPASIKVEDMRWIPVWQSEKAATTECTSCHITSPCYHELCSGCHTHGVNQLKYWKGKFASRG